MGHVVDSEATDHISGHYAAHHEFLGVLLEPANQEPGVVGKQTLHDDDTEMDIPWLGKTASGEATTNLDQDKALPVEVTTDTETPDTANSITNTSPHGPLRGDQTKFLAEKLTQTQRLNFAKPFWSADYAPSLNTSAGSQAMTLNSIWNKLLEAGHPSARELQDDIQLLVESSVQRVESKKNGKASKSGKSGKDDGQKLMEWINDSVVKMANLPPPRKPKAKSKKNGKVTGRVAEPKTGDKRGAADSAQGQPLTTKQKLPRSASPRRVADLNIGNEHQAEGIAEDQPLTTEQELPGCARPSQVVDLNIQDKDVANISAREQPLTKKQEPPKRAGPSKEQEREMRYALKQADAYRNGKNSNKGKTPRDYVFEKVKDLLKDVQMVNETTDVEASDKDVEMEEGEDEEVNDDPEEEADDEEVNDDPEEEYADHPEDEDEGADCSGNELQSSDEVVELLKTKSYDEELLGLSRELPSQKQIAELERVSKTGPNFLGRTASLVRGWKFEQYHKKSNGYTSPEIFLPAADSRRQHYCSHKSLGDMTQGLITYMMGNHLIWKDLTADEFLSYSKDPLFLVVHALRRYHEGQGDVTIQFFDRREAKAPDGKPAIFWPALDVFTVFEIPRWSGWGASNNIKLHPRKFTQEYVSHGEVLIPNSIFKQAYIQDLIKDGLYKLFPEFEAPEDHKRAGLYTLQVVYRTIGCPPRSPTNATDVQSETEDSMTPMSTATQVVRSSSSSPETSPVPTTRLSTAAPSPNGETSMSRTSKTKTRDQPIYLYDNCARLVPMTVELLDIVRKVTMNFRLIPEDVPGVDASSFEPPLHAFICFLTFEKRQKEDPVFIEWIKNHYQGISSPLCNPFYAKMLT
jgi:hypothetical protein